MWVTAKECAGVGGFPTDPNNVRNRLLKLAAELPEMQRKREGTKAFEFHVSILPAPVQAALLKKQDKVQVGEKVFDIQKSKATKSYCR
ncbi:DNA-binding protein, partial [Vibrio fluvialis]